MSGRGLLSRAVFAASNAMSPPPLCGSGGCRGGGGVTSSRSSDATPPPSALGRGWRRRPSPESRDRTAIVLVRVSSASSGSPAAPCLGPMNKRCPKVEAGRSSTPPPLPCACLGARRSAPRDRSKEAVSPPRVCSNRHRSPPNCRRPPLRRRLRTECTVTPPPSPALFVP